MVGGSVFLPSSVLVWVTVTFVLQVLALTTTWWATYTARVDLGKGEEKGHYGLWTLCSTKAPHWVEDCDLLDTFFQMPRYSRLSGIVGILHLVLLLILLPLGSMRTVQIIRNVPDWGIKPNILCIIKVSVAFVCVILAMLVAILISLGEDKSKEYTVKKSWSFWVQVSVIAADVITTFVCVTESIRYWQEHMRDNSDPTGARAETYGNPSFDSGSPESVRRYPENGRVSYTSSSGEPHYRNEPRIHGSGNGISLYYDNTANVVYEKPPKRHKKQSATAVHRKTHDDNTASSGTLTYENPSFYEHSPRRYRRSR